LAFLVVEKRIADNGGDASGVVGFKPGVGALVSDQESTIPDRIVWFLIFFSENRGELLKLMVELTSRGLVESARILDFDRLTTNGYIENLNVDVLPPIPSAAHQLQ